MLAARDKNAFSSFSFFPFSSSTISSSSSDESEKMLRASVSEIQVSEQILAVITLNTLDLVSNNSGSNRASNFKIGRARS